VELNSSLAIVVALACHVATDEQQTWPREPFGDVGAIDPKDLLEAPKNAREALGDRAANFIAAAGAICASRL
jgi:hypothetical protein